MSTVTLKLPTSLLTKQLQSHTILGSKTERGLTQLSLELLFRTISSCIIDPVASSAAFMSLQAADASEAQMLSASQFLETISGDGASQDRGYNSRAQTPMMVGIQSLETEQAQDLPIYPDLHLPVLHKRPLGNFARITRSVAKHFQKETSFISTTNTTFNRRPMSRVSTMPDQPTLKNLDIPVTLTSTPTEIAIIISMYEVYNDRIFDLLAPSPLTGHHHHGNPSAARRRHLLFKSTELSPDRKVVAGLRKIACNSYKEALLVLETGLHERRVAGTGSNATSSRSHGFFCVEVMKRAKGFGRWKGAGLTIVDLAGKSTPLCHRLQHQH